MLIGLRTCAGRQRLRRVVYPKADGEPVWVENLDTVEQLRHAFIALRDVRNTTWLIERHSFKPPAII